MFVFGMEFNVYFFYCIEFRYCFIFNVRGLFVFFVLDRIFLVGDGNLVLIFLN